MNTESANGNSTATIEGKRDVLVKDIKTVVGDSDVLLRGIAGAVADSCSAIRARVEVKLGHARSRLEQARTEMAARARGLADSGQTYVRDNSWKVFGAAAIVGLAIGYLLRRR